MEPVNARALLGELDPKLMYRRWLKPGDLVFDLGANIGIRAQLFLDMGLRVVSVEPQPECAAEINPEATVIVAAVAATEGKQTFYPCRPNWLSTLSTEYIEKVGPDFDCAYQAPVEVDTVTIDGLIDKYGWPAFVKIDIEGGELDALRGLTRPVPALSFEMHSGDVDAMWACVRELERLGDYQVFFSPWESFMEFPFPPAPEHTWGDVYAILK